MSTPRLSCMASLSLIVGVAFWPGYFLLLSIFGPSLGTLPHSEGGLFGRLLSIVFASSALAVVLGASAYFSIKGSQGRLWGRKLALAGVVAGTLTFVPALFCLSCMVPATQRSNRSRATVDTKTAVFQAIVYGNDKGAYPTSLRALRDAGYANVPHKDPWGQDYVLSPTLTTGAAPQAADDVYVYSKGLCGTGTYKSGVEETGKCGAVGYSSVHLDFGRQWR